MICETAKYKLWKKQNEIEKTNLERVEEKKLKHVEFKFFRKGICPNCSNGNIKKKIIKADRSVMGSRRASYLEHYDKIRKINPIGTFKKEQQKVIDAYSPFEVSFKCLDCKYESMIKRI